MIIMIKMFFLAGISVMEIVMNMLLIRDIKKEPDMRKIAIIFLIICWMLGILALFAVFHPPNLITTK